MGSDPHRLFWFLAPSMLARATASEGSLRAPATFRSVSPDGDGSHAPRGNPATDAPRPQSRSDWEMHSHAEHGNDHFVGAHGLSGPRIRPASRASPWSDPVASPNGSAFALFEKDAFSDAVAYKGLLFSRPSHFTGERPLFNS